MKSYGWFVSFQGMHTTTFGPVFGNLCLLTDFEDVLGMVHIATFLEMIRANQKLGKEYELCLLNYKRLPGMDTETTGGDDRGGEVVNLFGNKK